MERSQNHFWLNWFIFLVGIILVLIARALKIDDGGGDSDVVRVFSHVGIGMIAYAPIRLLIFGYGWYEDYKKGKSIAKLFRSSVRVVKSISDMPILFASDIDGCIVPPNRAEVDLVKFARLRRYCEFVKEHKEYPQVIFFTGRSQGYVELLAQSLGMVGSSVDVPFVIENGAALYLPTAKKTIPLISTSQVLDIISVRQFLGEKFSNNEFEPKSYMVTLNPIGEVIEKVKGETVDELREKVTLELKDKGLLEKVVITSTASSVDISPKDVNKLSGLIKALEYLPKDGAPAPLKKVVGFGDQIADLRVLRAAGRAYCPIDSHKEVRDFVTKEFGSEHIVELPHIDFVVSIIERECGLKIV